MHRERESARERARERESEREIETCGLASVVFLRVLYLCVHVRACACACLCVRVWVGGWVCTHTHTRNPSREISRPSPRSSTAAPVSTDSAAADTKTQQCARSYMQALACASASDCRQQKRCIGAAKAAPRGLQQLLHAQKCHGKDKEGVGCAEQRLSPLRDARERSGGREGGGVSTPTGGQ